jgi:hypothetical protein
MDTEETESRRGRVPVMLAFSMAACASGISSIIWITYYTQHSALQDRTPAAVGAMWVDSGEPRESTAIKKTGIELEITGASVAFQM